MPNSLFGAFNPFAEEIDGDWIVYPDKPRRRSTSATSTSTGLSFYEVATLAEVSDPPLRTEVIDDWTGADRPRPRPRADPARLVRRGRRGRDDDLGELPGRRPERGARRDQRAPLGLLPDRAPPRLHHRARLRAGAGRLPVDPADRRPARPDRPELGQGLDHRGQRHPRREVLGRLARQGGLDRATTTRRCAATSPATSTSSSRCSPPGRSAGTASTSARTSSAATRSTTAARTASSATSAACSPRSRTTTSTTSRSSASSTATRSPASSCTRRSTSIIRHNRIHDCSLGTWLDWQTQGTRVSRNLFYRQQPGPVRRGQPRPVPGRAQRPRLAGLAGAVQPGRRVRQQPRLRHRAASSPSMDRATPYHRTAQHAGRRLRRHLRRRRPLHRQRLPRRRRQPRPTGVGTIRRFATGSGAEHGTAGYDGHPASLADYLAQVDDPSRGDHERFMGVKQPVYIRDNVYAGGASRTRPSRSRSSSTAPMWSRRSSTKAPRSTWSPACRPTSTASASASSPDPTSNASGSSTPSSRNATAARQSSPPTWSAPQDRRGSYPAGPIATLASGVARTRVWSAHRSTR